MLLLMQIQTREHWIQRTTFAAETNHHRHHLICKQLKQIITTVQYVKDSRYNQAETAPTVALDTTNTSTTTDKNFIIRMLYKDTY